MSGRESENGVEVAARSVNQGVAAQ
jgi:hypothetical protein